MKIEVLENSVIIDGMEYVKKEESVKIPRYHYRQFPDDYPTVKEEERITKLMIKQFFDKISENAEFDDELITQPDPSYEYSDALNIDKSDKEFMMPREHLEKQRAHFSGLLSTVLDFLYKQTGDEGFDRLKISTQNIKGMTNIGNMLNRQFQNIYSFQIDKLYELIDRNRRVT